MSGDTGEAVRLLLLSRDYPAALDAARAATHLSEGERSRLQRMALARAGRFAEAAAAGRAVLAADVADAEDHFRQAEILVRLDLAAEALPIGLEALRQRPDEIRYVVPVIQAVLLDPSLGATLRERLQCLSSSSPGLSRGSTSVSLPEILKPLPDVDGRDKPGDDEKEIESETEKDCKVALPVDLPHYLPFDGPHPWVMGLVTEASDVAFHRQVPEIADLAAAILALLPRAQALTAQLEKIHPLVGRADAAAYVAHRFPSGLYAAEGAAIDLLPFLPFTLAPRPFVMVFDFIGNLFSPPMPFEDTQVDPRRTPHYWILRSALEADSCAAIVTNYLEVGPLLGGFFGSRRIAEKCVFVNPVYSLDELDHTARDLPAAKQPGDRITLLFTASVNWREEGFYVRGGIDVLNAFLDLAERHPSLELVLRSRLPANLSPRLKQTVAQHPRIRWLPDFIAWDDYRQILDEADLFLMPTVALYRNGLVQAMRWGIVPVIGDCMHAYEMLEPGVTGVVVPGRGFRASVSAADQRYSGDWVDLLRATDRPVDRAFYERYRDALDALIAAPGRIAAMRAGLLDSPGRHRYATADRDRFSTILRRAIAAAPGIDLSPEAVFPVQPRHRPGDPLAQDGIA